MKKEEPSFIYTLVLGVCMLLSLLLIGKMLLQHPTAAPPAPPVTENQQGEPSMELQISENDLATLIVQAVPFTTKGLQVGIGSDGTIEASASISRDALAQSELVDSSMRTALLFLPDPCTLHGAWRVSVADGAVQLSTVSASIAGLALPETAVNTLTRMIAEAVNDSLREWGVGIGKLEFSKGSLLIRP